MRGTLARLGSKLFWLCWLCLILGFVLMLIGAILFQSAPEALMLPFELVKPLFLLSLFANLAALIWPRDKAPKHAA